MPRLPSSGTRLTSAGPKWESSYLALGEPAAEAVHKIRDPIHLRSAKFYPAPSAKLAPTPRLLNSGTTDFSQPGRSGSRLTRGSVIRRRLLKAAPESRLLN